MLRFPRPCVNAASNGLNLWFHQMIPTLFPFMILTGVMIQMDLTASYVGFLKPALFPAFRISDCGIYAILVGFLCGFPMGAVVISSLYQKNKISKQEAQYLLCFCNNIGPVYYLGYALPVLGIQSSFWYLIGMYGIPLLYGIVLRYTIYKNKIKEFKKPSADVMNVSTTFLCALDETITSSMEKMMKLGAYMILFQVIASIFTRCLSGQSLAISTGLLEINGGIKMLASYPKVYPLTLMVFGGFCCLLQTKTVLSQTDLSLEKYFLHKVILTAVSFVYFLVLTKG